MVFTHIRTQVARGDGGDFHRRSGVHGLPPWTLGLICKKAKQSRIIVL